MFDIAFEVRCIVASRLMRGLAELLFAGISSVEHLAM
jgi:hypothetical protein